MQQNDLWVVEQHDEGQWKIRMVTDSQSHGMMLACQFVGDVRVAKFVRAVPKKKPVKKRAAKRGGAK
jgi:hypothetical protein